MDFVNSMKGKLSQASSSTVQKAKDISEQFRMQLGLRRLMEFLTSYHLPPELGQSCLKFLPGDLQRRFRQHRSGGILGIRGQP